MSNEIVHLVRAYSTNSGNYLWIGGEQSANVGRARYWYDKAEAQKVIDLNQEEFEKINTHLASRDGYGSKTVRLEIVTMTRKELMLRILKG